MMLSPHSDWIRWLGEGVLLEPASAGNKAATLQLLRNAGYLVVDGFCVTTHAYRYFLEQSGVRNRLEDLLRKVDISGYEIIPIVSTIQRTLREAIFPSFLDDIIFQSYSQLTTSSDSLVVVRSSAIAEDLPGASSAGIYTTILNVDSSSLLEAIRECWCSLYSLSAVYYRKKHGLDSETAEMAVLMQKMIHPSELGIVFTRDPLGDDEFVLEWSSSVQKAVTNGHSPTSRIRGKAQDLAHIVPRWAAQIVRLGRQAEQLLGFPLDIEWAQTQGSFYILQARPITLGAMPLQGFRVARADDAYECRQISLRNCTSLHVRWWSKHQKVRRIARLEGIEVAECVYVEYGSKSDIASASAAVVRHLRAPYIFLDINDQLRTIIVPRDDLVKHMVLIVGTDDAITIRVRECFTGQLSLLSGMSADDMVLVEHTPGGIKGLIRGLSAVDRYLVNEHGTVEAMSCRTADDHYVFDDQMLAFQRHRQSASDLEEVSGSDVSDRILQTVANFTRRISRDVGKVRLEWCVWNGTPYLVDYSLETPEASVQLRQNLDVISSGVACGRAIVLKDLESIAYISDGNLISVRGVDAAAKKSAPLGELISKVEALSRTESVILVAKRPYSALAVLIDMVDGFIFDDGALLSHLAILLREAHKPSVLYPGATALINMGDQVTINVDGSVQAFPEPL